MAVADMPLPPELAGDEAPVDDEQLARLFAAIVEMADEAAVDVGPLAREVADDTADQFQHPHWMVEDLGGAEWAMRHVAEADGQLQALRWQADEWARKINDWFVQGSKPLVARREFFAGHLERWALVERDRTGKKSQPLPSGTVATTSQGAKVAVGDEPAVIAWVDENLEPDEATEVAPVGDRRLLVSKLRDHLALVETPVQVLVGPCGCIVDVPQLLTHLDLAAWSVGSAVSCPSCDTDGLVGRWTATELIVRDLAGRPVPGTFVEPERVTAKAKPS